MLSQTDHQIRSNNKKKKRAAFKIKYSPKKLQGKKAFWPNFAANIQ